MFSREVLFGFHSSSRAIHTAEEIALRIASQICSSPDKNCNLQLNTENDLPNLNILDVFAYVYNAIRNILLSNCFAHMKCYVFQ